MSAATRLLSQSGSIFAMRLFGAGVIFLAQAAIARFWGAGSLGDYLLVLAAVNIVAALLPLGFQTIGTYFAAEYRSRGEGDLLRRFMARAYGFVAATSVVVLVAGAPIVVLMGEPGRTLAAHWLPVCLMAAATAVVYCNSALLVGLQRPLAGFAADTVFRPLLIVFGLAIATLAFGSAGRLAGLFWLLAGGFALIAAAQFAYVLRAAGGIAATHPSTATGEPRRWWRFALPWVMIALATDFFFDIDLILLSGILDRESLAVFGVMARVFSLIAFGVAAVYAVTLPGLFERNAAADPAGFAERIGAANLLATGIALALLLAVGIAAPLLPLLFGPAFAAGVWPLAVLSLALVVRSALGPAALVLSIHDRPYAPLPAVGLGLATLVGFNLLLVPAHGLMGAAVAALLAQSFWSAAMWLTARHLAGIDVSILPPVRALLARPRGSTGSP